MTRVMLAEEGIKIGTDKHDDVVGVAWAVRNRHDNLFFDRDGDMVEDEDAWVNAAVSGIHGMNSTLAVDPANGWGPHFETEHDLWVAHNTARDIAQDVLSADASEDITGNAIRWSDGYCNGGVCIDKDNDQRVDNIVPWERTHFGTTFSTYDPTWCVSTVPTESCK